MKNLKKILKKINQQSLYKLINISISYNKFPKNYINMKKVKDKNLNKTLLNIFFYSEYELYDKKEIKKIMLKYFSKNLSEMPLYINRNVLDEEEKFFNSIPIIATWRLLYSI